MPRSKSVLHSSEAELAALELELLERERQRRFSGHYRDDPVAYATERLSVRWWQKQQEIARSVAENKFTFVQACHSIGKTHLGGGLVLWWYESRNPSICLTSAPSGTSVSDLLWKEVRVQAPPGIPLMPKAPVIDGDGFHYAKGHVARTGTGFQGRHEEDILIIFDEATAIDQEFWISAESMLTGPNARWLVILNPTDTTSYAHEAQEKGNWNIIVVNALHHPNIVAELAGLPAPYPKAVRLEWVNEKVRQWCNPISTTDHLATDLEWPPASGIWYRPGPLFEGRVLGRWPSQSIDSVWSDAQIEVALRTDLLPLMEPTDRPCEIGVDVARFGDDMTTFHVRRGPVSLHHESHNGWSTARTAGHCKDLARQWGRHCKVDGQKIPIKIDDSGVGGGVVDQADTYNFIGINASHVAFQEEDYPNRRSELWFATAERASEGLLDLSRLPADVKAELKRQLKTPKYKTDSRGRRAVEPKADYKKRMGRSPDDADAFNIAYAPDAGSGMYVPSSEEEPIGEPAIELPSRRRPIEKLDEETRKSLTFDPHPKPPQLPEVDLGDAVIDLEAL